MSFWTIIGLVLLGLLLGIDVYLATDKVVGNTWSEILRTWSKYTPFIPWFWSVMIGHWFHPNNNLQPILGRPNSLVLLVWITWLLILGGMIMDHLGHPIPAWTIVPFGILAGVLLFPV